MIAHNIADPSLVSWGMAADAALKLAVCVYEDNIVTASDQFGIPFALLAHIFQGLNMKAVEKKWDDAMMTLEPWTGTYELTEQEQRNIQLGLDQLWDAWVNLETMRDSLYSTAEAFDDIFRTKGEHKKALRQIKQMQIIRD